MLKEKHSLEKKLKIEINAAKVGDLTFRKCGLVAIEDTCKCTVFKLSELLIMLHLLQKLQTT